MNSGLNSDNPTLVAAFRSALLHQGIVALLIFAVLAVAWIGVREWVPAARQAAGGRAAGAEPAWRQVLRIGFGMLWIFDGLLQAQPAMAAGLPSQVIEPTAADSPPWVQHLVNWAGTAWSYHPIQAGAAAVWIQVGIGAWLIAAPRGPQVRLAGLASAGWGLVVWVFGESFGGIFAPGLSWLFGAPGAAAFYCAAGVLIALPDRHGRTPALGRAILAFTGVFFLGMALLQAWPGRGFWQGTRTGHAGTLAGMIASMSATPQPRVLAAWARGFGSLAGVHGFAVNLFAVTALAVLGAGLASAGRLPRGWLPRGWLPRGWLPRGWLPRGWLPRGWLLRVTVAAVAVLCLADWVLVQDFGFFGGLGTDPNSMIPIVLVTAAGYLALTRAPAPAPERAAPERAAEAATGWPERMRPARLARAFGAASTRAVLAAWAVALVVIGAAPMALAQASPDADPIIAQAIDGNAAPLDFAAPAFTLTDQYGRQVSLASLRGRVVLLTFLDPVCTSDCPLIAQEFRQADQMLGARSRGVELVAIVANPLYRSVIYTRAFDRQERLSGLRNWLYLTGTLAQLQQAWKNYGISAQQLPAGAMIGHSDVAYVIDARGRTRTEFDFDPGPGTSSSKSSFAAELSGAADHVLTSP